MLRTVRLMISIETILMKIDNNKNKNCNETVMDDDSYIVDIKWI
jgi:hypothetical protein